MRRLLSVSAALAAVSFLAAGAVQAQTLDEIIAKNLKSKGGLEKIRATNSVKMTGKVAADGKDITMTIWAKRPNMMRREYTVDGQTMVNAFDGTTLWVSAGTAPPQPMPGPQAAYAKQESEFDSVFVDYKEKGHAIEFLGKETTERQGRVPREGAEEGGAAPGLLPRCRDRPRDEDQHERRTRAGARRSSSPRCRITGMWTDAWSRSARSSS